MAEEPFDGTVVGHEVFVSYAPQDTALADAVVENLKQHGITCRINPRHSRSTAQYADKTARAIDDTQILVLLWSEHAVASAHVGREIEWAASGRRRIIVLRSDPAPLPRSFEYFLSESLWIDVAALGAPAALTKLAQSVEQRIAPTSWLSPGLGTEVRNPADRKTKPTYRTMKRLLAVATFLVAAAIVLGVLLRYWPK